MVTILAIEDHDDVQSMLVTILHGHNVILAPDGASGLRMARESAPDLILLDVGMPDVDGLDVCRAIRSDPSTATVPIILVTAHVEVFDDPAVWQGAGADLAVLKPFSPARLVADIERLLTAR